MQSLEYTVPTQTIKFFREQAKQKIETEGWGKDGRPTDVKVDNFVHCWTTEEAFKQILIAKGKWFRHRGLYFGDADSAGADFIVKIDGQEVSVGLRSVAPQSLYKWKSVAYPDDRIREEPHKIAKYHIVCNHSDGHTKFFGIISREDMLHELENAKRLYSKQNQEYFRTIPLEKFSFEKLHAFLESINSNL